MANPNPNQAGLRPFAKGQSGNPAGRPKKPDIDELNRYIEEQGLMPQIAEAWCKSALGDPNAPQINVPLFKLLVEYRNGVPPKDRDDGESDGPVIPRSIQIEFVDATERSDQDPTPE